MNPEQLASKVRTIPDFPKPGIIFRDITTLLQDAEAFNAAIEAMLVPIRAQKPDVIVGIESRGFIFGAPIAHALGLGFVPVRKLGKLPGETITVEYELEYGKNVLELQRDALTRKQPDLSGSMGPTLSLCPLTGRPVLISPPTTFASQEQWKTRCL